MQRYCGACNRAVPDDFIFPGELGKQEYDGEVYTFEVLKDGPVSVGSTSYPSLSAGLYEYNPKKNELRAGVKR